MFRECTTSSGTMAEELRAPATPSVITLFNLTPRPGLPGDLFPCPAGRIFLMSLRTPEAWVSGGVKPLFDTTRMSLLAGSICAIGVRAGRCNFRLALPIDSDGCGAWWRPNGGYNCSLGDQPGCREFTKGDTKAGLFVLVGVTVCPCESTD